ncbi:MAG: DUF1924 domain-containing protein [Magnetospirillum sp.]|nr:DUF1924 domain-containing protein [Magnetospirillum sp.]
MAATAPRRPGRLEFVLVRLWHAALVGGFVVAYATGDEDTYAMHLFAGWLVVALVALRLLAGGLAPANSPLKLRRPNRSRLLALGIAAALAGVGIAALTGVAADALPFFEHLHEGLAEVSLWVALAHVAVAVAVFKGRKWLARWRSAPAAALLVLAAVSPLMAAEPARDAILAAYAAQARAADPAFAGWSPARGEALYRSRNAVNPDAPSCASCHTDDPTRPGRHVRTGRAIEPVAVSANPKRFTDAEKVEERFARDCKSVLGRVCTAVEKGDYVAFMAAR